MCRTIGCVVHGFRIGFLSNHYAVRSSLGSYMITSRHDRSATACFLEKPHCDARTFSCLTHRLSTKNPSQEEQSSLTADKKTATSLFKNAIVNVIPRRKAEPSKRSKQPTVERNFITAVRAMSDFFLKPEDLEGLRKIKRRSPYEGDVFISVYWRSDVEKKAYELYDGKEGFEKEKAKRLREARLYQKNIFDIKRLLRDFRKKQKEEVAWRHQKEWTDLLKEARSSEKVVWGAIFINGANFIFKTGAWLYTGSHSMFSEAIHSFADTLNQVILAVGIRKSIQRPDMGHPYGYSNMRNVASLISGVGIFCVGCGLSCYHGFLGLVRPEEVQSLHWAFLILFGSLVSEGATLIMAANAVRRGAKQMNISFTEYGVLIAASCMGLTAVMGSPIPDAIGSLLVGGLLGSVASFIIYSNVNTLVGRLLEALVDFRSVSSEQLEKINEDVEKDVMIRAIHDVKGIDMGNSMVRYKAEVDFDGRELTRCYLERENLQQLLQEMKEIQSVEEVETFLLKHGENIVDMLGEEIDRIETELKKKHPEIRHCDLELL